MLFRLGLICWLAASLALLSGCAGQRKDREDKPPRAETSANPGNTHPQPTEKPIPGAKFIDLLPATDLRSLDSDRDQEITTPDSAIDQPRKARTEDEPALETVTVVVPQEQSKAIQDKRRQQAANPPLDIELDGRYTLQLLATQTQQEALDFAEKFTLDVDKIGITRIRSQGKLWFVLAYGFYTSAEQARLASQALTQQGLPEPWVRSLTDLEELASNAIETSAQQFE